MGTTTKWLGKADPRTAHRSPMAAGERPKSGLCARRRICARDRAYRRAARAGRERNSHRFHRWHQCRRADRRHVCQRHFARRNGAARQPITRFRDFGRWTLSRMGMASNDRLEGFSAQLTPAKFFSQMNIPLRIVATDLMNGNPFISPRAKSGRRCALRAPIPDYSCRWNIAGIFSWTDS